jgi:hypothetical protein
MLKDTFFIIQKKKSYLNNELAENINISIPYIKKETIKGNENFGILKLATVNIFSSRF